MSGMLEKLIFCKPAKYQKRVNKIKYFGVVAATLASATRLTGSKLKEEYLKNMNTEISFNKMLPCIVDILLCFIYYHARHMMSIIFGLKKYYVQRAFLKKYLLLFKMYT